MNKKEVIEKFQNAATDFIGGHAVDDDPHLQEPGAFQEHEQHRCAAIDVRTAGVHEAAGGGSE